MKKGVSVLVVDEGSRVLLVTRPDGKSFGLPGGKVDPEDPSLTAAAIRELWEETGLKAKEENLIPIFNGVCGRPDIDVLYDVTTYYLPVYQGQIQQKEDVVLPVWGDIEFLIKGSQFAAYNQKVFEALGQKFPSVLKRLTEKGIGHSEKEYIQKTIMERHPLAFKI